VILRESHKRGLISRVPHYNSIFNYLEDEGLTDILKTLVRQSSLPLASVETDFALDSSGFGTSRFTRWYDQKYGRMREKAEWGESAYHVRSENQRHYRNRNWRTMQQ